MSLKDVIVGAAIGLIAGHLRADKGVSPSVSTEHATLPLRQNDNEAIGEGAVVARREMERELGKLVATLSAAGVATAAALGQARALGLVMVILATVLFVWALAQALLTLFGLRKEIVLAERLDLARSSGDGRTPLAAELKKKKASNGRGLVYSAGIFGSAVLVIALGAAGVQHCPSNMYGPVDATARFLCTGISEFREGELALPPKAPSE